MTYTLEDLVGLRDLLPEEIRAKIKRSKVFAKILAYLNYKGIPITVAETAKELRMDRWLVNKNLILMVEFGILKRVERTRKLVLYIPVNNADRPVYKEYLDDVKIVLGLK